MVGAILSKLGFVKLRMY